MSAGRAPIETAKLFTNLAANSTFSTDAPARIASWTFMFPTTACIAILAVFQAAIAMLLRPAISRWLERRSVWKAILLDPEARSTSTAASYGKLREPLLRLSNLLRAFNATSVSGRYTGIGLTDDPASRLIKLIF